MTVTGRRRLLLVAVNVPLLLVLLLTSNRVQVLINRQAV